MIRRQQVITNYCPRNKLRCYKNQLSFRKVGTVTGSSLFEPTILYKDSFILECNKWIGKILIPWNGENVQDYVRSVELGTNDPRYINEFEIANKLKPNNYRILYAVYDNHGELKIKSIPQIDYVPSRVNLILTAHDNIIRLVSFF